MEWVLFNEYSTPGLQDEDLYNVNFELLNYAISKWLKGNHIYYVSYSLKRQTHTSTYMQFLK